MNLYKKINNLKNKQEYQKTKTNFCKNQKKEKKSMM